MDSATNKTLIQLASLTAGLAWQIKWYRKHFGEIAPSPDSVSQAEQFQLPLRQFEKTLGNLSASEQVGIALHKFFATISTLLET
ncbi:MAG: hypothetical protein ABSH01_28105 [Terriglobia bacterium]|jgi:hypothetical protein